jgi:predicted nucleic acid-binding protein
MKRLFLDTNIVIDLLAMRAEHYQPAAQLFTLADKKRVALYVSALTMANAAYSLLRYTSPQEIKTALRRLQLIVKVLPLDEKVLNWALNDQRFQDFEDALQYFTALEAGVEMIISRNAKDFSASELPVMNAAEYLILHSQQ